MIKLIVGKKGSGKTKRLITMTNEAVASSSGNVVCLEKGLKLTYDITHKARLVDTDEYGVSGFEMLYGFIAGLMAGNYDITHIFIDSSLKIGNNDIPGFVSMVEKLSKLSSASMVDLIFTVSCDIAELPETLVPMILL